MDAPKEEIYQATVIPVAKPVIITAETESSMILSTSKMRLMTIEGRTVDKPTNCLNPARGVYEAQPNGLFQISATNFSMKPITLHKCMAKKIGSEPPGCVVEPQY